MSSDGYLSASTRSLVSEEDYGDDDEEEDLRPTISKSFNEEKISLNICECRYI